MVFARLFVCGDESENSLSLSEKSEYSLRQGENSPDTIEKRHTAFSLLSDELGVPNFLFQSRRLPPLQVVSNSKFVSVGVGSPTEINAPRGCAVILYGICQLC